MRRISADSLPQPHNFLYRLVSSQRFLAIIGLGFLLMIIFPLARTYSQRRLVEKEINDIKEQIKNFENQNQELDGMISYLQSDQALEEQARLNLNLKKPGEKVVVIENKTAVVAAVDEEPQEIVGNFLKWWRYFFD
ncbi:MAG: septum formation initiator family protein [Patescibacteria group bacterium]